MPQRAALAPLVMLRSIGIEEFGRIMIPADFGTQHMGQLQRAARVTLQLLRHMYHMHQEGGGQARKEGPTLSEGK